MTFRTGVPRTVSAADEFVTAVATRVQREIARVPAAEPAAALAEAGGKYLRARLLWLSAAAVAPRKAALREEPLVRAATAIELAHLGSLIHDDIVDGAAMRRGVASAHLRCGTAAAYLAGTALLHLGSALVADFPTRSRTSLARAVLAMCRGQVRELMGLFQPCSRHQRLAIMRDKTAALLEATASLGLAVVGGSLREQRALRAFAQALGIAYQIKDDLMDLVGDPVRLGRANGADLWDGVMTLPVLIARERSQSVALMLQRIQAEGKAADVAQCLRLVRDTGAVEAAATEARQWAAAASRAVRSVRTDAAARCSLGAFARDLVRVQVTARVQLPEAPARAHPISRLRFSACDAGSPPARTGNGGGAGSHAVEDALVLRRLARIEPTLADTIRDLAHATTAPALTVRPSSPPNGRAGMPVAIAAAARAIELARLVSSADALTRSPCAHVVAADCLEAVAFACLAESHNTLHAYVEELCLARLRSECRPSSARPSPEHRSWFAPLGCPGLP